MTGTISHETKEKVQKDYESITNFGSNWLESLANKYNLTENQILSIIRL
jgi:Mor family transcriptional regulator